MAKKQPTIEYVTVEAASLRVDIKELVSRGYDAARRISDLGDRASDSIHGVHFDDGAQELRAVAACIRSDSATVLALAAELMACSGIIDEVASVYEARIGAPDEV